MEIEQTIEQMKSLRLSYMSQSLQERMSRGEHRDLSSEEFVGILVEDECNSRKTKKIKNLIRKANLRGEKPCLENIRYEKERGFSKKDISPFYKDDWIKNAENMVFTGATGTGKSYLAEALVFQACKSGFRAKKLSMDMLLEEVRANRALGQYQKYIGLLNKISVLVIDDFAISDYKKNQYCELLHILEERTGSSSTIITSQYATKDWHSRIPDPTVADAICDRLIMGSWVLNMKGPSQRRGKE